MDTMEERRNAIVSFVNEKGNVTFSQLKLAFPDVSEMTLRTDLKSLDAENRIVRVHGGAKSVEIVLGTDDLLGRRSVRNVEAKQEIVRKALKYIRPNTTVFLDSGSTTTMLAENWPDQPNFIFTNSLTCAMALSKLKKPKVFMPSGELNEYSLSLCGLETLESLKKISFDTVFIGITSYDTVNGLSCGVLAETQMKRMLLEQQAEKIVLLDTSKVGKKSTFKIDGLENVDVIITENPENDILKQDCMDSETELV